MGDQPQGETGGKGGSGSSSVTNGMSRGDSLRLAENPSTKHSFVVSGAKFVVDSR
eukprot:CAMPEP_0185849596 /NCGR_PEP_ID=MMETSP1354-20130828/4055_1 /TAXON_ID=708628 /ORGANISM="Erythrolobus madagascarensis, Strain CCMP3276" /LENGTH=54 /DNA_ID=CAMNT_0028550153 /DNA_START=165 /DNA_END=325 /DNA_ORIENTATION=+